MEENRVNLDVVSKLQTVKFLEMNYFFYVVGLILIVLLNLSPYLYFKYYKKKNFISGSTVGIKHAI
jgi:hypothetical protein